MTFKLPELPYGFDFLEPVIDAKTMEIHHDKHQLKRSFRKTPRIRS